MRRMHALFREYLYVICGNMHTVGRDDMRIEIAKTFKIGNGRHPMLGYAVFHFALGFAR